MAALRIAIQRVTTAAGRCRVAFSCPLGHAWAYWEGDPPDAGSAYHVEIDLDADEVVRLAAAPRLKAEPSISAKPDGTVVLRCVVVGSDEGCTVLQLGGHILLVDVESPDTPAGTPVVVEMRSVRLFPYDL